MEILKYLPNGNLMFIARGNAYIKMLNDFDKKLCDAKHLQVIGNIIKFTAKNPNSINIDKYDDFGKKTRVYPAIEYYNRAPVISHYWTSNEYVPTYMGYHNIDAVSSDTLKYFNIKKPTINKYELLSNDRILDEEVRSIMYVESIRLKRNKNKYKINVPNIVCVYGNNRRINSMLVIDSVVSTDNDESNNDESNNDESNNDESNNED
jgi:hypothetical protein